MRRAYLGNLTASMIGILLAICPVLFIGNCEQSMGHVLVDVTGAVAYASSVAVD